MNGPSRNRARPVLVTLAAIAAQVPLFWAFASSTEGSGIVEPCQGDRCRPSQTRIQAAVRPPPPPPPLSEEVQVVETPDQPDIEKPKPVETQRVSDKTTRAEEETKAQATQRKEKRRPSPVPPDKASKVQSADSASPEPTVTDATEEKIEVADAREKLREADKGAKRPDTVLDRGKQNQILLPPGSNAAALANMQALAGDYGTSDHLPDVKDGAATVLNADRHRYADFFLRVKSQVERHWKPNPIYTQRDPTGELYGVKDRYTVLRVELDPTGKLLSMLTVRASGLDFMDEEAKRAMNEAAPFLNPPRGLINEEGRIRFQFGFYFEITKGRLRTNWKRL